MQETPLTLQLLLRRIERESAGGIVISASGARVVSRTWAKVAEQARKVIALLEALRVDVGDTVATFAWNDLRHLELMYGVPCAGRVLHPVNVRLHADHVRHALRNSGARVVFVEASLTPLLAPVRRELPDATQFVILEDVFDVDPAFATDPRYEDLLAAISPAGALPVLDERWAASICHTSGTTGLPKGVVYSHRSTVLHSLVVLAADTLGVSAAHTILPITPMFHAGAWGLPYAAGWAGATLVLNGADASPGHIASLVECYRITMAAGVPTVWHALAPLLADPGRDFGSLREIVTGGATASRSLKRRYADHGVRIRESWGMTELSPNGTIQRPWGGDSDEGRASIGVAFPAVELRIVDETGSELPWDGESSGELQARGPWVCGAYLNPDDDSDDARFHDGWFRTGDIAVIGRDGEVRLVDRSKDLIKSGGEWISSAELEAALLEHADVEDVAVVAVPEPKWQERPFAFVVAATGTSPTAAALREFLSHRVAKWWIPDAFQVVPELPRTSVGKVDKRSLRRQAANAQRPSEG